MDEASRHRRRELLAAHLGDETPDTLMRHLPPYEWSDIATSGDVDRLREEMDARLTALEARLEGQIAELRGDLRGDIARLERQIAEFRTELKEDIAAVDGRITELRSELTGDNARLERIIARQAWIMTVGVITATSGAVAAVAVFT